MSADVSGKPVRPKRVRYVREERGGEEVNVVHIDEGADSPRDGSGSQEVTRDHTGVQRELIIHRHIFIAAAVCLSLLCVLMVVRTTHMAMDCQSDNFELQNNYKSLQTDYNNLTLERDNLQNIFNELDQAKKQLEQLVNQLMREKADKVCPRGWKQFGCSCYYRSTEWKTWEESRAECLKTGADLVVINNNEEQDFISSFSSDGSSWIGLIRAGGNWEWVDETPLTTLNWFSGYPSDNLNRNCVQFWHGTGQGSTNTECSNRKRWICEK